MGCLILRSDMKYRQACHSLLQTVPIVKLLLGS